MVELGVKGMRGPSWTWKAGFGDEREQHWYRCRARLRFSETGRGEQELVSAAGT